MSCSDYPYNISDFNTFDSYITNVNYNNNVDSSNNVLNFSLWNTCLNKKTINSHYDLNISSINTILNKYNIAENTRNDTANELNNYSMTLYKNDLYFTYGKTFFFIILICSYVYFFRINGIIEPIFNLFNIIKTKIVVDLPKTAGNMLDKKLPIQKTNAIKTNSLKPKIPTT